MRNGLSPRKDPTNHLNLFPIVEVCMRTGETKGEARLKRIGLIPNQEDVSLIVCWIMNSLPILEFGEECFEGVIEDAKFQVEGLSCLT